MSEARRRLGGSLHLPFVVTARAQTGGRGRRGTPWASPVGGVWMTAALREDTLTQPYAVLVPLAVREAVIETCPVDPGRLLVKWPNDLLLDGKKICGTLCERLQTRTLLVGIGVNADFDVSDLPSPLADTATSLRSEGVMIEDVPTLTSAIVSQLTKRRDVDDLNRVLAYVGRAVRGRATDGSAIEGRVRYVRHDGALVLDTDRGESAIVSDAVHLIRPERDTSDT